MVRSSKATFYGAYFWMWQWKTMFSWYRNDQRSINPATLGQVMTTQSLTSSKSSLESHYTEHTNILVSHLCNLPPTQLAGSDSQIVSSWILEELICFNIDFFYKYLDHTWNTCKHLQCATCGIFVSLVFWELHGLVTVWQRNGDTNSSCYLGVIWLMLNFVVFPNLPDLTLPLARSSSYADNRFYNEMCALLS